MRIPRFKRSAVPAALVAAALLAASACGTTEKGAGDEETSAEAGPVSTVDFLGRTVELDKPAERVVILEWSEVEISISLGVMPVGVADIEGYNVWAGAAEPLDDSVTDVGMRSEASIDSIAGLNPDLVILENDNEAIIEPLEEFVPVLVTEGSNEEDNIARMQRDVDMIADLTGKNEEADALWADFEAKVAETAAAIEAGGRTLAVVCSLMLAACAVAVAGPIGFVGLAAPVAARLIARRLPGLLAHRVLIPFSALCGALVIVGADLALRATVDAEKSIYIPVGVTTTLLGAAVMVWLARSVRSAGSQDKPAILHGAANRGRVAYALIVTGLAAGAAATLFGGMLAGDTMLLGGDIFNWLAGKTGSTYTWIIDQRYPRVLAAILAGAALACAGTVTQGVCRNPLAEPGLLGVTAGAGIGAVTLITWAPNAGAWTVTGVAAAGGLAAFGIVYALAWRGGLDTGRLVLVGIGVWSFGMAVITLIILASDPWDTPKAMTWLSGSTYGRTAERLTPLAIALAVVIPVVVLHRKEIDLLTLDDDTPRTLGVRLERTRLLLLGAAAVLTAAAVAVVGVIGFVGLVAPHLARTLVGSRSSRVLPVSILLGVLLVSLADTLGRTVIAPAQIPAGLVCALIGTPYFIWLLWRTRIRG